MGKSSQSPNNGFIGLRIGKDSWQIFIDQEISLVSVSQAFDGNQSLGS